MPETSWEQDTIGAIITVLETFSGDFHVAGDFFRDFHSAGDFFWRLPWRDFQGARDFFWRFSQFWRLLLQIFTVLEVSGDFHGAGDFL